MPLAQTSDEFVKWDQKRQELEAKAQAKEEKAAQEGNASPESTTNPIANGESVDK